MSKTVEKIVIDTEGIDVISNINGVNSVTQISLEPRRERGTKYTRRIQFK